MTDAITTAVLKTVLTNQKNIDVLSKRIKQTAETLGEKDQEVLKSILYQVYGELYSGTGVKEVSENLKRNRVLWDSPIFDQIRNVIEEFDDYIMKPFEVVEGIAKCKCGSTKTWTVAKQTRSADEPMTTFSKCVECGNEWSYSG